jgi:hypothetical protein
MGRRYRFIVCFSISHDTGMASAHYYLNQVLPNYVIRNNRVMIRLVRF